VQEQGLRATQPCRLIPSGAVAAMTDESLAASEAVTMEDHDALLVLIRSKVEEGTLPRDRVMETVGAPGAGDQCSACDLVIAAGAAAIEGVVKGIGATYRFHSPCFFAWRRVVDAALPEPI
jgi:hypothetical protein